MHSLAGKKITVAGLGTHGGASGNIRWLHEKGAKLTVTDLKTAQELEKTWRELEDLEGIEWVLGEHREKDFTETDIVLRNPAMPRDSKFLLAARQAKVPVEMDSSLFMRFAPTQRVFGVTGSKGKTTTATALATLLRLRYSTVALAGVEGTSLLKELDGLSAHDAAVLELSSWRLEALDEHRLSPAAAIVTSLYPDHLNTYGSFEEYEDTKKAIIKYQTADDLALLNYDDQRVRQWAAGAEGQVMWYSLGDDIPGEGICVHREEIMVFVRRERVPLFPLDTIALKGAHEKRNVLPAIYLAFCSGVRVETLKLHTANLAGLSHRLETVRTRRGVTYINDSAATIPDATIAALESLKPKNLVLILGGGDKRLDFEHLARSLAEGRIRAIVYLPGNATELMRESINSELRQPPISVDAESMPDAVSQADGLARPGDIVLLSPGATSFGLFQHEFDRGDQFREAVNALPD